MAEAGRYRLMFETDADTLALCKLSYEKIGEADALVVPELDLRIQGNFNGWGAVPEADRMIPVRTASGPVFCP